MLYVAYGSNMSLSQMAHRCPKSKVVGVGKIKGFRLVFNVHADIIPTDNKKDEVPVLVWDIHFDDWKHLDFYEGYPRYYVKEVIEVEIDGKIEKATVYVMNSRRKGISPPSKTYFDCIEEGYIKNGIDTKYLYDVLEYSYENKTEHNQYKLKMG